MATDTLLLLIMAIVLPPLPVFLINKTVFTKEFLVSVLLTILGHIPGLLFSFYYILIEHPKQTVRLDEEAALDHGHDHDNFTPRNQQSGYTDVEPQSPTQDPIESPIVGSSDAPPTYNEVNSKPVDVKDNKVQL